MRPMALLMPIGGPLGDTIANGYADAFDRIGWDHMVCAPKTRLQMIQVLQRYDIQMIFTACKYGTPQLPVDIINQRKIKVVIQCFCSIARTRRTAGRASAWTSRTPTSARRLIQRSFTQTSSRARACGIAICTAGSRWTCRSCRWRSPPTWSRPAQVGREDERYRMRRQLRTQNRRVYRMGGPNARAARERTTQHSRRFRLEPVGPPRCSSHAARLSPVSRCLRFCKSVDQFTHRIAARSARAGKRTHIHDPTRRWTSDHR